MKNANLLVKAVPVLVVMLIGFWFFVGEEKNPPIAKNIQPEAVKIVERLKSKPNTHFEDWPQEFASKKFPFPPPASKQQNVIEEVPKQKKEEEEPKEEAPKYRHEDREGFDIGLLGGTLDGANYYYRDDFYAKLDSEIVQRQMSNPDQDRVEAIVEQFETTMDYALGVEYQEEKRAVLRSVQKDAQQKYATLDELLEKGEITKAQYKSREALIFEESLRQSAKELSYEEFEALFEISKEEIDGYYARFMEMLSPESAQSEE